jgi:hypothetical protein
MEPTNQSIEQHNDLTQEDVNEPADLEDGRERDIPDPISATQQVDSPPAVDEGALIDPTIQNHDHHVTDVLESDVPAELGMGGNEIPKCGYTWDKWQRERERHGGNEYQQG